MDTATDQLTDLERDVLELERFWFKHPGAKDTVVFERFGWTPTRYYQVLNSLIDRPEAEVHDPMLVRRLRRLRDQRRSLRAAR